MCQNQMVRYVFKFLFLIGSIAAVAQPQPSVKREVDQLKKLIFQHHLDPKPLNDIFSREVFHELLNTLDPDRLYFTQEDITALSVFSDKIDDELTGAGWNFLPAVTNSYKKSLLRTESIIKQQSSKPFDFTKNEFLISDSLWAANDAAMTTRWYENLKYETLEELVLLHKRTPEFGDKEFLSKKEAETRQRIQRNNLRSVHRILNHASGFERHVATQFLRTVSLAFDPHSNYMSMEQMENFLASLSTEGYYFGIKTDENERGEILITQLLPGGPAWKSGEIHTGDVIQRIRWEGSDWVEVEGMTQQEFDNLLQESVRSSIEFLLKQTGGIEKTVKLRKEKMSTEDNSVKSFILEGDKKIGYISLPGFYTDWEGDDGSHCANDVAREILKLKKENVEGLVLDVRHNGGGSMDEAVAMAGIFIDAGPIGVLKEKGDVITPKKDVNRGTVWDGPLLLMVNGFSASASEFLAAALQDYNRGIVVGSKTYGKATGQEVFDLEADKASNGNVKKEGWGYSTITTFKIYRVTGKTVQKRGVSPDIVLPGLYDFVGFGEASERGALPSDSISKKIYYTPLGVLPICELREKSQARVSKSAGFQMTVNAGKMLGGMTQVDTVSLQYAAYKKFFNAEIRHLEVLKETTNKPTSSYKIGNHGSDRQRIQSDEYARQTNEVWTKNLSRDILLEEAFFILCDYINGPNTK